MKITDVFPALAWGRVWEPTPPRKRPKVNPPGTKIKRLAKNDQLGMRWVRGTALAARLSRGKGRGAESRKFGNKPGKYMPHQGARECERRARRIAVGIV